jgi:putative transposase
MPDYRRRRVPGGTYFFTLVTYERRPIFTSASVVTLLRRAMGDERAHNAFEMDGGVVLPDHTHFLWTLPQGGDDYSSRIGRIKAAFTKALRATGETTGAGHQRGYADVWQPRFWEHVIRDRDDLNRHLDYIHYNPVRHGHVSCPHAWPHSSFGRWVERGGYEADWCCACAGRKVVVPDFADIAELAGE